MMSQNLKMNFVKKEGGPGAFEINESNHGCTVIIHKKTTYFDVINNLFWLCCIQLSMKYHENV